MKVAIIGAGVAGLSAAQGLREHGARVTLFDKGRGAGGRLSTRRAPTALGERRWDHGAQYFTVRDEGFQAAVDKWVAGGAAARWAGNFCRLDAGGDYTGSLGEHPRYVGAPAMNTIIKVMAESMDVHWSRRVSRIESQRPRAQLVFEDGDAEGPFDAVIVAVPAEQAVDLLEEPAPELAKRVADVVSAPCWAALLAFADPVRVDFDGAKIEGGPLSWIARNSAKPGRGAGETWVLHAAPGWSRANLERDADAIAADLATAFVALTGAPAPAYQAAHRWRYAQTEHPLGDVLWHAGRNIGACGDWCLGGKVEAAWLSGQMIVHRMSDA